MKKFFTLLVLAACCAAMTWGCSDDKYDDTEIRQEIENLKQEIASMKEQVNSLKTIIDALTAAGAIRIGNLSSVTDFSTFTQVLPRLSEQTWSVTDCSYNPTYQQMLDGETGAESK